LDSFFSDESKFFTSFYHLIYSCNFFTRLGQRPATGEADGAGFTGLHVPEQILKLFECQSILLKILRLCVKKNLVKLIPYWWNKCLKVKKIDHGARCRSLVSGKSVQACQINNFFVSFLSWYYIIFWGHYLCTYFNFIIWC
jgi:hypothetical protein